MKKKIFSMTSVLFTLIAMLVASSACVWGFYQPEEPRALAEKQG